MNRDSQTRQLAKNKVRISCRQEPDQKRFPKTKRGGKKTWRKKELKNKKMISGKNLGTCQRRRNGKVECAV